MLELPRGWNSSGRKGVFQRLQKQVKEKRQREVERDEVVSLSSLSPCIRRDAQILMTFNIESDLIFFLVKLQHSWGSPCILRTAENVRRRCSNSRLLYFLLYFFASIVFSVQYEQKKYVYVNGLYVNWELGQRNIMHHSYFHTAIHLLHTSSLYRSSLIINFLNGQDALLKAEMISWAEYRSETFYIEGSYWRPWHLPFICIDFITPRVYELNPIFPWLAPFALAY